MNADKVLLPELGEGVTEGELVKWLVSVNDTIKPDQVLAEVMTDKASMEVPSPVSGVVQSLLVKEGQMVPVGQPLLTLQNNKTQSHQPQKPVPVKSSTMVSTSPVVTTSIATSQTTPQELPSTKDDVLCSPVTRHLATELDVDITYIQGTGPKNRVTKADVINFFKKTGDFSQNSKAFSPPLSEPIKPFNLKDSQNLKDSTTYIPLKGIRKKIAERMQFAKRNIPHFTLLESANLEPLDDMKKSAQIRFKDVKITYLCFVMKALLHTAKKFPELNASIEENNIVLKNYYNFGFAVDTPKGLLVPVVHAVDKKNIKELAFALQTLAVKARDGSIKLEDMQEGTATITNIGSLGGHSATPIINPPETAILGMYRSFIKPNWDGACFKPQKTMNFSLTCDHRLIDGALSAKALRFFVDKIENPLDLFI